MATWKKVIVSGSTAELLNVSASNAVIVGSNQQITTAQATTFLTGSFTGSFKGDGTNLTGVTATAIFPTSAVTNITSTDKFFISQSGNQYITYGDLLTDLAGTNLVVEGTDSLALASQIVVTGVSASFTGSLTGALIGTASWATNAVNSTNAANVAVTDTTSGTGPYYIAFTDGTTGNRAIRVDSATLTFNAATNTLTATSSYAIQALSSSFASSASFATSASFAPTASFVLNAVSASFATTASFAVTSLSSSFASTASFYGGSVTSASFASTASFVNQLNQNVSITGSLSQGDANRTVGLNSHAEGTGSFASGSYSHAEGAFTTAIGNFTHTEGYNTTAINQFSHAEGNGTIASGSFSHTEGERTIASGASSHAEGRITTASGDYSHTEGRITVAIGNSSHAEGYQTTAVGLYSHAEGESTTAVGQSSHAEGFSTIAAGTSQHVQGVFNRSTTDPYAFILGNGASDGSRSNLIYASGSLVQITGSLIVTQGITGSLFGTSSVATNALSASYAATASFTPSATTSSYALFATSASFASTASFVLNAVSSSFAATASYALSSSVAVSSSYARSASLAAQATNANLATNADFINVLNSVGTTIYPLMVNSTGTGYFAPYNDAEFSFNPTTNILTTTSSYATQAVNISQYTINQNVGTTDSPTFNNLIVNGNLSVAGTASFTNTDNLNIRDKFILINSGSTVLADSGWITQYNAAGSGSAFYLEATSAGTYGRFAVAYDAIGTSTALLADEYVVTAKVGQAAGPGATNPTWGGATNGTGNMWVTTAGDIFIYS